MSNAASKRKQAEVDSSDTDSEVSFNLHTSDSAKRQRLNMGTPSTTRDGEDEFFKKLTRHFDTKAEEISLRLSLQLAPLQSQVSSNSQNIVEIRKSIAKLEENASSKTKPANLRPFQNGP